MTAGLDYLFDTIEPARREEVEREARRVSFMDELAKYRWHVAQKYHQTDTGKPMDFKDRPFQEAIYKDAAPKLVISGSVQYGKSELLIVTAAVMAASGLRVIYVFDKADKRDRVVAGRMDPTFAQVPLYRRWIEDAKTKGRKAESLRLKHVGAGSILFVGANSPRDFASHSADVAIVDEHQLCEPANLGMLDNRISGSEYRYKIVVGNPRLPGSEENANLDWEYQNTCQNEWNIPCDECGLVQQIDWWTHCVREQKNRSGGILSVEPRDQDWKPTGVFDLRPVCMQCDRPMNRLSRKGQWISLNPGHPDHGYRLSNIHNVNKPMRELFGQYIRAKNNPTAMQTFVNDQLGLPFRMEGTSINEKMLAECSTGQLCGLSPYRFLPAHMIRWREL